MKKQMFTRRIMLATLLALFACLQSFATNRTYYSKAVANATPTGAGTVYVSNTSADDAENGTHAESSEATNNSSAASAPTHRYYLHAIAAQGKGFAGWATSENGTIQSTDNPLTLSVTAATSEANATQTRYAIFKDLETIYSILNVYAGEGGKVFASNTATDNRAWAAQVTQTQNSKGAGKATHEYYIYAQPDNDYEFIGWATSEDGEVISKEALYKVTVNAESTDSEDATAVNYYAKFKKRELYHSKVECIVIGEGGSIFANINDWNREDQYKNDKYSVMNSTLNAEAPIHNYYLYAKAEAGAQFIGWSKSTDGSNILSTESPYVIEIKADSQDENNPVKETYYAIFKKTQTYYSRVWIYPSEGGAVAINRTGNEPGAYMNLKYKAENNSDDIQSPKHSYYLFAKAKDGYMFEGWAKSADGEVLSNSNKSPFEIDVETYSTDANNPTEVSFYAKFKAVPGHYSKLTLKLNGNNDISNLGTAMLGGKVYVGRTAAEAESAQYEWTSESTQVTFSESTPTHEYYLYAKADEGFEFAGFGTTASATTSFNNQGAHPYKVTIDAASTDETAPTEKTYYASFKYAADNKPTTAYANFTVVTMLSEDDGTGKYVNVESDEVAQVGITYGENATETEWHETGHYSSEEHSAPYSATLKIPFTVFVKPNAGYEFIGWATTSTQTAPSAKGNTVDDYNWYYSSSSTNVSISSNAYPGSCGVEGGPKTKKIYPVFRKIEQMDEPTGTTPVEVTEVTGTTELVEGSVAKNFSVDLVLNEDLPYDVPGSDKNAKPAEVLKQFVTVTGANGNKSDVASYSLVYESTDLGEGGIAGDGSKGTLYSSHTIRLFFPYDIKADTYTVHLPYGLYTTVNDNKTPTYEFTITVTEDTNPYLTIKKQLPREGLVYTYTAQSQTSQDRTDPENGKVTDSNITVEIEFNEIVNSIDQSKASGIALTNTAEGINYRYTNLTLPAQLFGKVDGRTAIAYPELINGDYTITIPEGLFVGNGDKVNKEITINFSVTGFRNATLKPYEMATDQITPKANNMTQTIERLDKIAISYQGEFGDAEVLIGKASGIKVQRYTEEIDGSKDGGSSVRTYYPVQTTASVEVVDGKMVVSFTPALFNGLYEVQIPAAMAANMDATGMTMAQKVNAGYAETPAYPNLSFNVVTPNLATATMSVNAQAKWGTFMAPFIIDVPEGVTAYAVENVDGNALVLASANDELGYIPAYAPVLLYAKNGFNKTFEEIEIEPGKTTGTAGLLTGTLEPIASVEQGNYLLQNQGGKVGFYKVAQDNLKLGANRCYLTKPATGGDVKAFYMDQETAIKALEALTSGKAEIYDLNGRKLNKMQKGVNIVNGVKVLVK